MRNLTHYELTILIKNQIQNMQINAISDLGINILFCEARAQEILEYIREYNSLKDG